MTTAETTRTPVLVAYICFGLSIFIPVLAIVGVIINHLKGGETEGLWTGTHHRWLKRTFWYGLLWSVLGGIFALVPVLNILILPLIIAVSIWYIYRVVRGLLKFFDNKPMYPLNSLEAIESDTTN